MGRPCGGPWYRPRQCEGGQFFFPYLNHREPTLLFVNCKWKLNKRLNFTIFILISICSLQIRAWVLVCPGGYIFQRPFLRGLFLEGLIFGGAYLRSEISVSKSIGLTYTRKEIYRFCFVLLCI